MFSRCRNWPGRRQKAIVCPTALLLLSLVASASQATGTLTVCADPNNLPFSNQARQGFENRIAEIVARDLGRELEYVWWSQRRNFLRDTIAAGRCNAWIGVPSGMPNALTTSPYYRSSYVFVSRNTEVKSLDDAALAKFRIGVHVVGDAFAPPAQELARHGIVDNIIGYSLFGEASEQNPAARLIGAVTRGELDIAIAWGPLAGYFAKRQPVPLEIFPIPAYAWDISVAVSTPELKAEIDRVLEDRRTVIQSLLDEYSVPRVP